MTADDGRRPTNQRSAILRRRARSGGHSRQYCNYLYRLFITFGAARSPSSGEASCSSCKTSATDELRPTSEASPQLPPSAQHQK